MKTISGTNLFIYPYLNDETKMYVNLFSDKRTSYFFQNYLLSNVKQDWTVLWYTL